jgi:polysaccharide deacetylase family protein (PEP-CTERM system associated)
VFFTQQNNRINLGSSIIGLAGLGRKNLTRYKALLASILSFVIGRVGRMINALTIDVEDYFQVQEKSNSLKALGWEKYVSRIERNTYHILDLFNRPFLTPNSKPRTSIKATFFCLGWIAKKFPQLIKELHAQGHEIACHGYTHHLIYNMSKEEFRRDIRMAKGILEDLTGDEVVGYRAPCFSITPKSLWALKILAEEGFKYDSSIFPIRHDFYGIPSAPRFPFMVSSNGNGIPKFKPLLDNANVEPRILNFKAGISKVGPLPLIHEFQTPTTEPRTTNTILEFPISTLQLVNKKFPISNGDDFNRFPYFIIRMGLKRINEHEGQPFILHLHPWELNFDQHQTIQTGWKLPFSHSRLMEQKEKRLRIILEEFPFSSIKTILSLKTASLQTDTSPATNLFQSKVFV